MDFQYDSKNDQLFINFTELTLQPVPGFLDKTFPAELQSEIGLLFSENGHLTGLEISPASKYFDDKKLAKYAQNENLTAAIKDTGLQPLSAQQYSASNASVLFEDKEHDAHFGAIQQGSNTYKFGWVTDRNTPTIKWLDGHTCAVGIDKNFAIVNFQDDAIVLEPKLNTSFVELKVNNNILLVITQLEIFKISKDSYEIIATYDLPDFFVSIEILGDIYKVHCFDDSEITIA